MTKAASIRGQAGAARRPVLRFVGVCALMLAVFYAGSATPWFRQTLFPACLKLNAQAAAVVLRAVGENAQATDTTVHSPRYAITIQRGCDAVEPSFLFVAAVLAFPAARIRARLAAALIGAVLLQALNVIRIVSLFLIGIHYPGAFDVMHVDVWQALFIVAVMLMWIIWAWRITRVAKAPSHAHP